MAMRHFLPSIAALLFLTVPAAPLLSQADCGNVVIESVQYDPLFAGSIDVKAYYDGAECISYPSFMLFDQNGDTLAIETTNFFCVGNGSPQTHPMTIRPGVQIPTGAFDARLELYTDPGDSLACSWDLTDVMLCPSAECQQVEIYLTNTGDLVAFTAYWWVLDENGTWVDQGTFEVDDINHTHFETTCLVPGNYELGFSPFSPIDDSWIIGVTPSYQQSTGINTHTDEGQSSWDLSFSWFAACVDPGNSIDEPVHSEVVFRMDGSVLHVNDTEGLSLGSIQIYSADGRMARSLQVQSDRTEINMSDLASGLHVVRIIQPNGMFFTRSIILQ
jgi:hypothetical protein